MLPVFLGTVNFKILLRDNRQPRYSSLQSGSTIRFAPPCQIRSPIDHPHIVTPSSGFPVIIIIYIPGYGGEISTLSRYEKRNPGLLTARRDQVIVLSTFYLDGKTREPQLETISGDRVLVRGDESLEPRSRDGGRGGGERGAGSGERRGREKEKELAPTFLSRCERSNRRISLVHPLHTMRQPGRTAEVES